MNISQLEYFVTTVQCGSFSTAARELFVTPQAVSKAVGDLERELRVRLFEKAGRGIEPTPFGIVFAERADEILSCLLDLETLAKNHAVLEQQEGSLTVAVAASAHRGNVILPSDFDGFGSAYPKIDLTLQYRESGVCLAALEEHVVDAAIILGRTSKPDLSCVKLFTFSPVVAVWRTHPLAQQGRVSLEDLCACPIAVPEDLRYCYPALARHIESRGLEASFRAVSPFQEQHRRFLEEKGGALLVANDPLFADRHPSIALVPLDEADALRIPLCLAYHAPCSNTALASFERYLVSTAALIKKGRR